MIIATSYAQVQGAGDLVCLSNLASKLLSWEQTAPAAPPLTKNLLRPDSAGPEKLNDWFVYAFQVARAVTFSVKLTEKKKKSKLAKLMEDAVPAEDLYQGFGAFWCQEVAAFSALQEHEFAATFSQRFYHVVKLLDLSLVRTEEGSLELLKPLIKYICQALAAPFAKLPSSVIENAVAPEDFAPSHARVWLRFVDKVLRTPVFQDLLLAEEKAAHVSREVTAALTGIFEKVCARWSSASLPPSVSIVLDKLCAVICTDRLRCEWDESPSNEDLLLRCFRVLSGRFDRNQLRKVCNALNCVHVWDRVNLNFLRYRK